MTSLCQMASMFRESNVTQGTFARLKKKKFEVREQMSESFQKTTLSDEFSKKCFSTTTESFTNKDHDQNMLLNINKNYSLNEKSQIIEDRLSSSSLCDILSQYQTSVQKVTNNERFLVVSRMEDLYKLDVKKIKTPQTKLNPRVEMFTFNTESPDDIVEKKQKTAFK